MILKFEIPLKMCRIVHIAIHGSEYIKNVCGMFSGIIQDLFQEFISEF